MSKLSFRARALDASKPMPIYLAEELPDLPDYSAINRAVPQMPSGMEKEEESEHHLQRAISGTGLIIPTPEVCQVSDIEFYERCYPPDYKMPKQHIHMQPLWEEQEAPEYDMDSEDERWLKQQRHPELTDLKFEQMMDKLEKSSGQTVVTLNEAKLLLERHDDLVIAVYDYWLNKRLTTQHPLILSVKTEHRPGQSSNNPYLAFRRRTEKMQTRKNRKNDESSFEKMLKLRRDLARALSLLEMVARRERAKRELVKLTALLAERRYAAGDFANQLLPEPPPRQYTAVPLTPSNFRRETYSSVLSHYSPRPQPTPADQPRQRENKRTYKRRKPRHAAVGSAQGLRDSGVYTSSEDEGRAETASPPDDGPFAFRRKAGCFYEMPTSTLCGDPVDPGSPSKEGMFQHEFDPRHRYTLTSITQPYPQCIGFARRRMGRGGRLALDRISTPLDDLWHTLPFDTPTKKQLQEEKDLENKWHRTPMEITRDYHTSGAHPWRHAFRRHLARRPHLWISSTDDIEIKQDIKSEDQMSGDLKLDPTGLPDVIQDSVKSDISVRTIKDNGLDVKDNRLNVKDNSVDIKDNNAVIKDNSVVIKDKSVVIKENGSDTKVKNYDVNGGGKYSGGKRKRSWSDCSDSSYDSDESLHPVEREFEKFIDEVNKKWLHFRPKTPSPSPPPLETHEDQFPIAPDTAISVELRTVHSPPSDALDTFTTAEFTLGQLYPDIAMDADNSGTSGTSLDISGDDLLGENFTGLTEAQVESILSETDLKSLSEDGKKIAITDDLLDELVSGVDGKETFLLQGQSGDGRADSGPRKKKADAFGSSCVTVVAGPREPLYCDTPAAPAPAAPPAPRAPAAAPASRLMRPPPPPPANKPAPTTQMEAPPLPPMPAPAAVPSCKIIVEEVNDVPIKLDKKKKDDTVEEVQLSHGVQLKTVQTKHSPLKKHVITSGTHRVRSEPATSQSQPQIVTVAVSDSLKVRLQNHLLSSQSGVLVQNGPFPPLAVAVPVASQRETGGVTVSASSGSSGAGGAGGGSGAASGGSPRRAAAPLVQLAPAALSNRHYIHPQHNAPPVVVVPPHPLPHHHQPKLKVLHAHPLSHAQRAQLLAHGRPLAHLPAVVSLATIHDAKTSNATLIKAAGGSVAQLFEIKSGQLGKGPHLVNVVRQPQPGKTTLTRLDLNDKKRPVVFDGALKGNVAATTRPHRVNVSLDGRQIVRTTLPATVRAPNVRHQIQLKNRTLQVAAPQIARSSTEPSTSITIAAPPTKTASIPSSVVANLLHKNVALPKSGQKIAISGPGGQALSANVQAIAFSTAHVKARQARLIARPTPVTELVEANTAPVATSSQQETPLETTEETETNGTVRRRTADTLPMEVT